MSAQPDIYQPDAFQVGPAGNISEIRSADYIQNERGFRLYASSGQPDDYIKGGINAAVVIAPVMHTDILTAGPAQAETVTVRGANQAFAGPITARTGAGSPGFPEPRYTLVLGGRAYSSDGLNDPVEGDRVLVAPTSEQVGLLGPARMSCQFGESDAVTGEPISTVDVTLSGGGRFTCRVDSLFGGGTTFQAERRSPAQLVSALPTAPQLGEEVYFEAAAGVRWHLVWDGAQWAYLGGPPLTASAAGEVTTTSTSYVDLGGPSVTLPAAGAYDVRVETRHWHDFAAAAFVADGCALPAGVQVELRVEVLAPSTRIEGGRGSRVSATAPGTLAARYRSPSGIAARWAARTISARPVTLAG